MTAGSGKPKPLFDAYVMIDWCGGDRRRAGRSDCIWIAHGAAAQRRPLTVSPASRSEALLIVRKWLERRMAHAHGRVLIGADFAYGYPAGFAALLRGRRSRTAPWLAVWRHLRAELRDDIGTAPGSRPSNCSNRFELAAAINRAAAAPGSAGPFWCLHAPGRYPSVPQRRPPQPFAGIAALRITDERARSDTPFRLFGTGSVGSQALTGIPRIAALRFDPEFAEISAVWPFETGWADGGAVFPPPPVRIVHAEIYPSIRAAKRDAIKDRGQVRAMWHWARDLDSKGALEREFARPEGIERGSAEERVILDEEGWILGCNKKFTEAAAP